MPLPNLMTVDVGGTPIAIRDTETEGPAVVLLHGLGGSSQTWAFQFRSLADHFRVIAWDMPGYGASGGFVRDNPTAGQYAYALDAVLDLLEVGKVHVVGQSVSALIGASYAAEHPDRMLSYVFCQGLAGLGGLPNDDRAEQRKARLSAFRALGPERFAEERGRGVIGTGAPSMVTELAVTIMKRVPEKAYCQAIEMMAQTDFFEIAPRIDCPALVIAGGLDPVAPVEVCEAARKALVGASMSVIDGAGHYGCMENPAAFNAILTSFFKSCERR